MDSNKDDGFKMPTNILVETVSGISSSEVTPNPKPDLTMQTPEEKRREFIYSRIQCSLIASHRTDLEVLAGDAQKYGLTVQVDQPEPRSLTITEGDDSVGTRYVMKEGRLHEVRTLNSGRYHDQPTDWVERYTVTCLQGTEEVRSVRNDEYFGLSNGRLIPERVANHIVLVPIHRPQSALQLHLRSHQFVSRARDDRGAVEEKKYLYDLPDGWERKYASDE